MLPVDFGTGGADDTLVFPLLLVFACLPASRLVFAIPFAAVILLAFVFDFLPSVAGTTGGGVAVTEFIEFDECVGPTDCVDLARAGCVYGDATSVADSCDSDSGLIISVIGRGARSASWRSVRLAPEPEPDISDVFLFVKKLDRSVCFAENSSQFFAQIRGHPIAGGIELETGSSISFKPLTLVPIVVVVVALNAVAGGLNWSFRCILVFRPSVSVIVIVSNKSMYTGQWSEPLMSG